MNELKNFNHWIDLNTFLGVPLDVYAHFLAGALVVALLRVFGLRLRTCFVLCFVIAVSKELIVDVHALMLSQKIIDSIKDVLVTLIGGVAGYKAAKYWQRFWNSVSLGNHYFRWVAVGDIHGQFHLAKILLDYIEQNCLDSETQVIILGDVLDRSSSEIECSKLYEYLKDMKERLKDQIVFLKGNHEDNYDAVKRGEMDRIQETQAWEKRIYNQYASFLGTFVSHVETKEYFFSHAGGLTQDGRIARKSKTVEEKFALFWNHRLPRPPYEKIIVRGHCVVEPNEVFREGVVSIDLGSNKTNRLGAVILPDQILLIAEGASGTVKVIEPMQQKATDIY